MERPTHKQIDHILLYIGDGIQVYLMSNRSVQQTMILTKVRDRLAVRFRMERFNLKKLNEVKGKEQYRVQAPNTKGQP
jgi:hypothetical protein